MKVGPVQHSAAQTGRRKLGGDLSRTVRTANRYQGFRKYHQMRDICRFSVIHVLVLAARLINTGLVEGTRTF